MRRFFVPEGALGEGEVTLPRELARRLATVLRLKRGDRVLLCDCGGADFEVELTALSPRAAKGKVVGRRDSPPEPAVALTLYQSLVRPQRFELVLEKGTELGVSRFVPLLSGRAQPHGEGGPARLERWRRIVREAAEQCGRGRLPHVDAPTPFDVALADAQGLLILPWEGERATLLRSYLRSLDAPDAVSLFVGPEGGFTEAEVARAVEAGCATVSLGPRILRSETAGIAAAALVMYELGEMG